MIRQSIVFALQTWKNQWRLLSAIIVITWWPADILQSVIDFKVLSPDDFRGSFKWTRFIDLFLLIIPCASIYYVGLQWSKQKTAGLMESIRVGFRNYGRMWLTRFCVQLSYLTLLLLIVPGVYWLTRWSMAEITVVDIKTRGTIAFAKSWELTKNQFKKVFLAQLAGMVMGIVLVAIPLTVTVLLPENMALDLITSLAASLIAPVFYLYEVGIYVQLRQTVQSGFETWE